MSILKGVEISSLAVILFIGLIAVNFFFGFHQLLYPQIYENALEKGGIYSIINEQVGGMQSINFVTIGSGGVESKINEAIVKILEYMRGSSDEVDLYWDINQTEVRNFLEGEVEKMRVCNSNEPYEINGTVQCRPANITVEELLESELKKGNVTILNNNESRINVLDIYDPDRNIEVFRGYVTVYRYSLYLLSFFILLIIAAILIIDKKRERNGLEWIGITFLIAGTLVVILSSLGGNFLYTLFSTQIPIIQPAIIKLIAPIFNSIKINGVITIIIGFVALVVAFFVKNKEEREQKSD